MLRQQVQHASVPIRRRLKELLPPNSGNTLLSRNRLSATRAAMPLSPLLSLMRRQLMLSTTSSSSASSLPNRKGKGVTCGASPRGPPEQTATHRGATGLGPAGLPPTGLEMEQPLPRPPSCLPHGEERAHEGACPKVKGEREQDMTAAWSSIGLSVFCQDRAVPLWYTAAVSRRSWMKKGADRVGK